MTLRRNEIVARARSWIAAPRRYSQQEYDPETGYRLDCSGYVSMTWGLEPPGLTTVELPDLCRLIEPRELLVGDALMIGGPGTEGDAGHIMLFDAWADPHHRTLRVYEQTGSVGTVHRVIAYPPPPYLAYRHRDLANGAGGS